MGQQTSSNLPPPTQRTGTIANPTAVRQYSSSDRARKSARAGRAVSARQSWPNSQSSDFRNNEAHLGHRIMPTQPGFVQSQRPVMFHLIHGSNIKLSGDRKTATRAGSFCNAVVFTNRAIKLNEPFTIQLSQSTSRGWSGVLRFGYTCHNPDRMRRTNLPKYVCPDLTVKPGNWAKALRESTARNGDTLSFYINELGDVYSSLNQDGFSLFFSNVDVSKPLWALIDVYGNTTAVKIVDDFPVPPPVPVTSTQQAGGSGDIDLPPPPPARAPTATMSTSESLPTISDHLQPSTSPLRMQMPLQFHSVHGHNIILRENKLTAERRMDSYCGGLVFTSEPLHLGHEFTLEILRDNARYIGHLGVGLTSCDPSTLNDEDLPKEADMLLDRPEYWVLSREFEVPDCGQTFGFALNCEGELHLVDSDGESKSVVMHVDSSIPLWLFLDIYGSTQSVQSKGLKKHHPGVFAAIRMPAASTSSGARGDEVDGLASRGLAALTVESETSNRDNESRNTKAKGSKKGPKRPQNPPNVAKSVTKKEEDGRECRICMEKPINTVLYRCGHSCSCLDCGNKLKGKNCPICRAKIDDVIVVFPS